MQLQDVHDINYFLHNTTIFLFWKNRMEGIDISQVKFLDRKNNNETAGMGRFLNEIFPYNKSGKSYIDLMKHWNQKKNGLMLRNLSDKKYNLSSSIEL